MTEFTDPLTTDLIDDVSPDFEVPVPEDVLDLPTFDELPGTPEVVGDPWEAAGTWHEQESPDTCAIAAQEFVLDSLTGVDHAEANLVSIAGANGWYTPGGGTATDDVGKVLEEFGCDVTRTHGSTIADVQSALSEGQGVIVGVDADELWTPGFMPDDDTAVGDTPGIPGQDANHAVQVIGVDRTDVSDPRVILNDPGHPDGRAVSVPEDEFLDAWRDSESFAVFVTAPGRAAA